MIKSMVKEFIFGLMEDHIVEAGKTESKMDKEYLNQLMDRLEKEFGVMEQELNG